MSFEELKDKVLIWAKDKDLLHIKNVPKQFLKFIEEVFEFKRELDISDLRRFAGDHKEAVLRDIKLEMGDIFVTLIILCEQIGIDPVECLEMAYEKIKNRKGRTIGGSFVKEEDLIDD
ncbi:MazG-like family protein [uncultured Anaerococcus sp.]|uniref:MazG-like family protein n=1 Tax=uncultured Anaerococcus sp. TaxID=293428 RepID=UPI002889CFD7|nr:MazG-like family protein [uncultured Anaerococcus sp.]